MKNTAWECDIFVLDPSVFGEVTSYCSSLFAFNYYSSDMLPQIWHLYKDNWPWDAQHNKPPSPLPLRITTVRSMAFKYTPKTKRYISFLTVVVQLTSEYAIDQFFFFK